MRIFWSNKAFREAARKEAPTTPIDYSCVDIQEHEILKEKALSYAFRSQKPKTEGFEKMRIVFIDSKGRKYYQYDDNLEMPMVRKGKLEMYYNWMASGITGKEIDMFANAIEAAADECINTLKADGKIKHLSRIGAIAEELRRRRDMIVHEDVCFRIIGLQYIREDQDPRIWDQEIEDEKVKQFREDSKGGLEAFFMGSPLKKLLPFSNMSESELTNYLNEFRATVEYQTKLLNISSSEDESKNAAMTSTKE